MIFIHEVLFHRDICGCCCRWWLLTLMWRSDAGVHVDASRLLCLSGEVILWSRGSEPLTHLMMSPCLLTVRSCVCCLYLHVHFSVSWYDFMFCRTKDWNQKSLFLCVLFFFLQNCMCVCARPSLLLSSCPYTSVEVGQLSVNWPTLAEPAALWFPLRAVNVWVWSLCYRCVCVYVCVCERLCVHACLTSMSTFVCACVLYNV